MISGPVALSRPDKKIKFIPVESAEDMLSAVMDSLPEMDVLIMAAAVGDYRPNSHSLIK